MTHIKSKIKLPRIIGDGMILQRNANVKLWGWGTPGEVINIKFAGSSYSTVTDDKGSWYVVVVTGAEPGPYDMEIYTEDDDSKITVKDILLGEVWLCSGQSNMEMKMEIVKEVYPEEFVKPANNFIRQFLVPVKYDFEKPQSDLEAGDWEAVNPQSISNFTAVGYFFAVKLYEEYKIPVGLINASLGGSPAEAWMSEEAISLFPESFEALLKVKDKEYVDSVLKSNQKSFEDWHQNIDSIDIGMPAGGKAFYDAEYDAANLPMVKVPSYWEDEGLGQFNGSVWIRKDFDIPSYLAGKPARLLFGNVIEEDTVYINGIKVGSLPMQYIPRNYEIPEGILKEGSNSIVVRVVTPSGRGGFYRGKPYCLNIEDQTIDLSGEWRYLLGAKSEPMAALLPVMWQPTGLYNAMLAPVTKYAIKGALWYQGETNAQNPKTYNGLLTALIADWRSKWAQGDFPFLFVQLPNYEESYAPSAGNWSELREQQRKTLSVNNTAMAVTIDVGEWNDVHPLKKKEVGSRLALAAQKLAYGDKQVVSSGPLFKSVSRVGDKLVITFSDIGSGLVSKDGSELKYFEIAGKDKKFIRATAKIGDDSVTVLVDSIYDPAYVRYAWADNPEGANLYNLEGLPASPFTAEV